MYCVVYELRENYSKWVQIFQAEECEKEILLGDGSIKENANIYLRKSILNVEIENKFLGDELEKMGISLSSESQNKGYDDYRIYYHVRILAEEEKEKIMELVNSYEKEDWLNDRISKLSDAENINKYVSELKELLNLVGYKSNHNYYKKLLKQIEKYEEKQLKIAKETNEPQFVWFEIKMEDEEKGLFTRQEKIYPNGKIKKSEGWSKE
jgi:hypothetical protein